MRRIPLMLLLACAGCSARTDLAYRPPAAPIVAPSPLVAEVRVTDHRGEYARLLGTVSGPDGLPLKGAYVLPSVADGAADAFRAALSARGELAPPGQGRYDLNVTLLALGAEQNVTRQAHADLLVALVERGTGRQAWSTRVYAERRGENWLAQDDLLLGSPEALGPAARDVLAEAIDRTLDRGGFVIALR